MPLLSDQEVLGGNEVVLQLAPPPRRLLSDEEILGPANTTPPRLLSDDELFSAQPRAPFYGAGDEPISDAEYQAMFQRQPQMQAQTPLGRIGEAASEGFKRTFAPEVPFGPSPETISNIASVPGVGPQLARYAKVGGAAADFTMRGLTAPFSAANEAIGQTAQETGLMSQGMAQRLKRDTSGLTEAAMLVTGAAPYAPRIPRSPAPTARVAPELQTPPPVRPMAESAGVPGAATVSEAAPPALATDRAGNINLRRIYAPDDVKRVIQEQAYYGQVQDAGRGVISHDQTAEMARLVGMTPEKLSKRIRGQAFNAEEMFAARNILVEQATKVRDLAKVAHGGSDAQKLTFSEELTRLVAIQEQVSGATAEAGRTLSQFRMMANASKEDIARLMEASKAGGLDDVLDKISALDDPAKVAQFASTALKAKTSDQVLEAWINALLSGPTTHATNILSNTLVAAWSIPETAVAAGISKFTGSGIKASEATARAFGFLEGAKDGIRAGWRTFKTEEPSDLASKIEVRKYRSIPSVKIGGVELGGKQVRIPGRLLMAEDEFFKAIGYRQEINAQAIRIARNEGLRGEALASRIAELKANPPDAVMKMARATAERQTFTNPLGKFGQKLMAMTRDVPALRIVMPFIRTPVNIVKYAAERSPFAPLFKEVRENLRGANGAAARDTQIARIGLGSAVSAVTAYMALEGAITGGGPADPKDRAIKYASGWQPYSIKIGDNYYSYGRLEPLGMLFGVAADFAELSGSMSDAEQKNIASLIMGSVQKNLVSKTWLRGLSEMIEAFQDPDRYGARYIMNLAGTLVPTAVAQYARSRDPYLREARTVLDKIKDRIPGLRETLPMRRDVFGEPIKLEGSLGPDLLSPIYQSRAIDDPVIAEMLRLKVSPSRPMRKVRGVELEPSEYEALQIATGSTIRQGLEMLISNPQWSSLPDEAKADFMEEAIRKSRDIGRATVLTQFPDLALRIAGSNRKGLH